MDAPLALYRRYRPDTFAEVIGQDHVTAPLRNALSNNRVNHAYLFSGPRGCGKTTSARILARAINCEQGPRPEPCGECQSCRDLARGGPGSIDVLEIDAASHGGVDDARELRERAFFAPVHSRFKIYIIDEAHMVTTQGFNALLKLVEEPPPHLKFIFATTEPDKVIGTIRSRTHHYPFRLVPPKVLAGYMAQLCESEGVTIEPAALPLVVRAGAGSVRDSLSVLDQLIGGAGEDGVTYQLAVALLGFTPDSLLDACMDAFAAHDSGAVFEVIDKVIDTGQDPKRFAEDLLGRLRDLVIVAAVPTAVTSGLIDVAADQAERLQTQASGLGAGELTRAADIVAAGLLEMRGATAPRLQLELICAKILLPGADDSTHGIHARLDRIERRMTIGGAPTAPAESVPAAGPAAGAIAADDSAEPSTAASPAVAPTPPGETVSRPPVQEQASPPATSQPAAPHSAGSQSAAQPAGAQPAAAQPAGAQPDAVQPGAAQPAATSAGGVGLADVRRLWPDILEAVKAKRRFAWIMLSQNAQVIAIDDKTLTLGLVNAGARESFARSGSDEILRQAMIAAIGVDRRVEAVVDPSTDPGSGGQPADKGGAGGPGHPAGGGASTHQAGPAGQAGPEGQGAPAGQSGPAGQGAPAGQGGSAGQGGQAGRGGPAGPTRSGGTANQGAGDVVGGSARASDAGGSSEAASSAAASGSTASGSTATGSTATEQPDPAAEQRRTSAATKRRAAEAAVAAEQAERAARQAAQGPPADPDGPGPEINEASLVGEDDLILEEDSLSHTELLKQTLGAQVIDEQPNP